MIAYCEYFVIASFKCIVSVYYIMSVLRSVVFTVRQFFSQGIGSHSVKSQIPSAGQLSVATSSASHLSPAIVGITKEFCNLAYERFLEVG